MRVRLPYAVLIVACTTAITGAGAWRLTEHADPASPLRGNTVQVADTAPDAVATPQVSASAEPTNVSTASIVDTTATETSDSPRPAVRATASESEAGTTAPVAPASSSTSDAVPVDSPSAAPVETSTVAKPVMVCWPPHDPSDRACDTWTTMPTEGP
jgi:hypothetical protein